MDVRRLEYFCAIVEQGQISRAARALNISQPPLSQRLKELEEEIGVTLIQRTASRWHVTPEGHELYQKAQFVLSYLKGMREEVRQAAQKVSGLVRVGICPPCLPLAQSLLPEMLVRYPELRHRLWVMDNQSLERHMQERNIDFALVQLPLQMDNYIQRQLPMQRYLAVYGKGLEPPDKAEVGVEDLQDVPLGLSRRRDGGGGFDLVMRAFQQQRISANIRVDSQDTRILAMLIRQEVPIVVTLPEQVVQLEELAGYPCRELRIPGLGLTPVLVRLRNAYFPHNAQVVMDAIGQAWADNLQESVE